MSQGIRETEAGGSPILGEPGPATQQDAVSKEQKKKKFRLRAGVVSRLRALREDLVGSQRLFGGSQITPVLGDPHSLLPQAPDMQWQTYM